MIGNTTSFLFASFPLTFFLTGLSCALIRVYRHRINIKRGFIAETFISHYLFWSLGICQLYSAILFIAFPAIASIDNNLAGNALRFEIGFAALGLGIVALLTHKKDYRARLAIVIATSVFLWGCAAWHLYQSSKSNTVAQSGVGFILWVELLQPLISIIALHVSHSIEIKERSARSIKNLKPFFIAIPASK